jgi:hypothetical protein
LGVVQVRRCQHLRIGWDFVAIDGASRGLRRRGLG